MLSDKNSWVPLRTITSKAPLTPDPQSKATSVLETLGTS